MFRAVFQVPKLSFTIWRHGVFPMGAVSIKQLKRGELNSLHWRILGESLARVLSHSGPVWTKIGQILATRDDIMPKDLVTQLEALYSSQEPMGKPAFRKVLKKTYGKELPFKELSESPLGVGSIGEVYEGQLKNGRKIVVKILRPGVKGKVKTDLEVLRFFLWCVRPMIDKGTVFLIRQTLKDLEKAVLREVDLENEAKNLQLFKKRYKSNKKFYVPQVFPKYSGKNILVMEKVEGKAIAELRGGNSQLSENILQEILMQILSDGEFHGDPHAGNLILMKDGKVAFIDLGLTGRVTDKERRHLGKAVRAFLDRDADKVIKSLLEFGKRSEKFDYEKFRKEIVETVKDHQGSVKGYLTGANEGGDHLEVFVRELFLVAQKNGVYVPDDTAVLIKTLVTIEGVARSLNPKMNLAKVAMPVVAKSLMPKWVRNIWR